MKLLRPDRTGCLDFIDESQQLRGRTASAVANAAETRRELLRDALRDLEPTRSEHERVLRYLERGTRRRELIDIAGSIHASGVRWEAQGHPTEGNLPLRASLAPGEGDLEIALALEVPDVLQVGGEALRDNPDRSPPRRSFLPSVPVR